MPDFALNPHPSSLPLVITMGDPCGIGPEIVAAQWFDQPPHAVVVGDAGVMQRAVDVLAAQGAGRLRVERVTGLAEVSGVHPQPGVIPVWAPAGLPSGLAELPWGQIQARAGQAAAVCVRQAASAVQQGHARALVTAPLHKESLALAGEPFPGHTELLQAWVTPSGRPLVPVRMMLANDALRVVLVSIHVSLRDALLAVTRDNVLQTIGIAHEGLQAMGIRAPRIAVAGLNPHAGEGGLFGKEEIEVIGPAVSQARQAGMDATGPWAPDTVFMRARHAENKPGEFDVVVAMYHDQGLIPVKYLGVEDGVNVTLGLPFVRTSPDHGTAFDVAGTGRADPRSLRAACRMALALTAPAPRD